MKKSVHVIISGQVQGVGYRAWTAGRAKHYGIDGWVRNRRDGTVEALFSGVEQTVNALIKECWEGPLAARVSDIQINKAEQASPDGFQKLPTV